MTIKKTKAATKGAKQIVEENKTTLNFYQNMIIGAIGIYFTVTMLFFNFTTLSTTLTIFSAIVYIGSYQFMKYIAHATYSESGQLLDSGIDLNMEGGIAEHVKDLIILTSGVQVLSLISNYFWLLWLLVPFRGGWMIWKQILAPWFFASTPEQPEISEKKQRKLEKKMARRH
ncbi:transmembrane protein 208 [Bombus vosnesenskii]|uniref:Transmembrane protein 208 n=3 Tax=Pyrobombus TaxID=144703 RepID=A0A6J3K8Y9_9HYME|nr:transmembrane protein 208 [Bombus impatiens]XP_033183073.1 transmembrane protein 208 [Bombus vancouverensis nearcticus]XP_033297780.1 transmembrane protein 208 [Bombus bifarius]XP_033349150.1 transmembrane protein 208 [Bombus vosnesenskii]XP_050473708.1 transmembrane protein 208 isoform X2 [Bombus huntii]XP_050594945.1 transmembrane protein 208 [Bombus affinis]XP_060832433.1 transmembrane protein 208 [Bombus pascuorum]